MSNRDDERERRRQSFAAYKRLRDRPKWPPEGLERELGLPIVKRAVERSSRLSANWFEYGGTFNVDDARELCLPYAPDVERGAD